MKTRIAIPHDPLCLPLIRWIERHPVFSVTTDRSDVVARLLRKREADVAFVTPLEYARESSEYRIVPGFAVSSRSGIELRFRNGLRTITSLAADPSRASEIVLAQIILREEFESQPPVVPMTQRPVDEMLQKADSALQLPDRHTPVAEHSVAFLDLAEAWAELAGAPYVHGFLCAREDSLGAEATSVLLDNDLADNVSRMVESFTDEQTLLPLLRSCQFRLSESELAGLSEFLRYAHFHGMIRDIPSLHFYGSTSLFAEN